MCVCVSTRGAIYDGDWIARGPGGVVTAGSVCLFVGDRAGLLLSASEQVSTSCPVALSMTPKDDNYKLRTQLERGSFGFLPGIFG